MSNISSPVLSESLGAVRRVTLNRPTAMNALNMEVVNILNAILDEVEKDDQCRALIITGTGPAFCAGADLKDAMGDQVQSGPPAFLIAASAMMNRLRTLPKPVIASLNGLTMAGGLELAMCADVIVASDEAKVADAHANFGVFPGAGGASILPRLIPEPTALYMLMTGKSLPARRLYDLGLISELHPAASLADATLALAESMAAKSPSALRGMKAVARASNDKSAAEALADEAEYLIKHLQSDDLQEGLRAFAEKRKPQFTGK